MSKFLHGFLQVSLVLLHVGNLALPYIAAPYNAEVSMALATAQGVLAMINHKSPATGVANAQAK